MAPTLRHGKDAKLYIGKRNFTPFITDGTVSASLDVPEVTTWSDSDKEYLPGGVGDVTASFDGMHAQSATAADDITRYFDTALGGSTNHIVTFGPEGDTAGRWAYLFSAVQTGWDVSAPASDVVKVALDLQGSGGLDSGVWLRALSTNSSSTGMGSAVACAGSTTVGGTTGGGVAHFHATSINSTGNLTVRVQHSTNGSTWATLLTFTAASTATVQRSTVSGTIKEQLRAGVSGFSTDGAATFAVAFARRGKLRG
jgi:hypothetical protein